VSRPREAALQGLAKMKFLHELGVRQAVLPPHPRPDLTALRRLGFGGSDVDVLWKASR
jgi:succinylarginine dihydrolase